MPIAGIVGLPAVAIRGICAPDDGGECTLETAIDRMSPPARDRIPEVPRCGGQEPILDRNCRM